MLVDGLILRTVGHFRDRVAKSTPGEVKNPTQGVNVYPVMDSIFYLVVINVYMTLIRNSVKVEVNMFT